MTAINSKSPQRSLGQRIAELRKRQGLTLARLAEVCELSEATLSRVENGHSAVSAQHLFALSKYLKVDIADFFRDDAAPLTPGIRSVTTNGKGTHQKLARYDAEILCADLSRKEMHPVINTIRAQTLDQAGGLSSHQGEEFLYVLEGELIIYSDLYAPTQLTRGDSLYFDGAQKHAYICGGDEPTRILVLVSHNQLVNET